MIYSKTVYSRAGLIGNPSDGYFGKTISVLIKNYHATVTLYESPKIEIIPSFQDNMIYNNLEEMAKDINQNGYYGGLRLIKAAIKKFYDYCLNKGIILEKKNFSIIYKTTIPRRLGLAGSSAIVTGVIQCLMEFFNVHISFEYLPTLILSVETEELDIAAGLQDRVIQVYGGAVYMDFDKSHIEKHGYGIYERLDLHLLPPLFLAHDSKLGEGSEIVHQTVKDRWLEGDQEVIDTMAEIASYAEEAKQLILKGDKWKIGPLLDKNFNSRKKIFKISEKNIKMIELVKEVGSYASLTGSGGAIIGIYEDENMFNNIADRLENINVTILKPQIY